MLLHIWELEERNFRRQEWVAGKGFDSTVIMLLQNIILQAKGGGGEGEAPPFHVLGRAGGTISDCSSFPGAPFLWTSNKKMSNLSNIKRAVVGNCYWSSFSCLLAGEKEKRKPCHPPPREETLARTGRRGQALNFTLSQQRAYRHLARALTLTMGTAIEKQYKERRTCTSSSCALP